MARAKRLQTVEVCAQGVLNTYGVLEKGELISILHGCYGDLSVEFLDRFVESRTGLIQHAERYREENGCLWWCCEWMDDPDGWIEVIQTRSMIPYKRYPADAYQYAAQWGTPKRPATSAN